MGKKDIKDYFSPIQTRNSKNSGPVVSSATTGAGVAKLRRNGTTERTSEGSSRSSRRLSEASTGTGVAGKEVLGDIDIDPAELDQLPVNFCDFMNYTNILEIVEAEIRKAKTESLEHYISDTSYVCKLARRCYLHFYTQIKYRKAKPLVNVKVKPNCPAHVQEHLMDIPEKYRKKRNRKEKARNLKTTEDHVLDGRPSTSRSCKLRTAAAADDSVNAGITADAVNKSSNDTPPSFKLFKKFIDNDKDFERHITSLSAGDKTKLKAYLSDTNMRKEYDLEYYRKFYRSPAARQCLSWKLRPCPRRIQEKLLTQNAQKSLSIEDSTPKKQVQFSPEEEDDFPYPVSFETFKTHTYHDQIVDNIFIKTRKSKEELEAWKDSRDTVFRNYYEAFYKKPEIRRRFKIIMKPCPMHIKQLILQIPGDSNGATSAIAESDSERNEDSPSLKRHFSETEEHASVPPKKRKTLRTQNTSSENASARKVSLQEESTSSQTRFPQEESRAAPEVPPPREESRGTQKIPPPQATAPQKDAPLRKSSSTQNDFSAEKRILSIDENCPQESFLSTQKDSLQETNLRAHKEASHNRSSSIRKESSREEGYPSLRSSSTTVSPQSKDTLQNELAPRISCISDRFLSLYIDKKIKKKVKNKRSLLDRIYEEISRKRSEMVTTLHGANALGADIEHVDSDTKENNNNITNEVLEKSTNAFSQILPRSKNSSDVIETNNSQKTGSAKNVCLPVENGSSCAETNYYQPTEKVSQNQIDQESSLARMAVDSNAVCKSQQTSADDCRDKEFFLEVNKSLTLAYVLRVSRDLKQRIVHAVLQMNLCEFARYTHIHGGDGHVYKDANKLKKYYDFAIVRDQVWPPVLFMRCQDILDYLRTKDIYLENLDLKYISPKFLHHEELASITNFDEIVTCDYRKETARELDRTFLRERRYHFYKRCWSHEKWIWKVPTVFQNWKELSNKLYLNDTRYILTPPTPVAVIEDVMDDNVAVVDDTETDATVADDTSVDATVVETTTDVATTGVEATADVVGTADVVARTGFDATADVVGTADVVVTADVVATVDGATTAVVDATSVDLTANNATDKDNYLNSDVEYNNAIQNSDISRIPSPWVSVYRAFEEMFHDVENEINVEKEKVANSNPGTIAVVQKSSSRSSEDSDKLLTQIEVKAKTSKEVYGSNEKACTSTAALQTLSAVRVEPSGNSFITTLEPEEIIQAMQPNIESNKSSSLQANQETAELPKPKKVNKINQPNSDNVIEILSKVTANNLNDTSKLSARRSTVSTPTFTVPSEGNNQKPPKVIATITAKTSLPLSPNIFVTSSGSTASQPCSQSHLGHECCSHRTQESCVIFSTSSTSTEFFINMPSTQDQIECLPGDESLCDDPLKQVDILGAEEVARNLEELNVACAADNLELETLKKDSSICSNDLESVEEFSYIERNDKNKEQSVNKIVTDPETTDNEVIENNATPSQINIPHSVCSREATDLEITEFNATHSQTNILQDVRTQNLCYGEATDLEITEVSTTASQINIPQDVRQENVSDEGSNQKSTEINQQSDSSQLKPIDATDQDYPDLQQISVDHPCQVQGDEDMQIIEPNIQTIVIDDDSYDERNAADVVKVEPKFLKNLQFFESDSNNSIQVHKLESSPAIVIDDDCDNGAHNDTTTNLINELMNPVRRAESAIANSSEIFTSTPTDDPNAGKICEAQKILSSSEESDASCVEVENAPEADPPEPADLDNFISNEVKILLEQIAAEIEAAPQTNNRQEPEKASSACTKSSAKISKPRASSKSSQNRQVSGKDSHLVPQRTHEFRSLIFIKYAKPKVRPSTNAATTTTTTTTTTDVVNPTLPNDSRGGFSSTQVSSSSSSSQATSLSGSSNSVGVKNSSTATAKSFSASQELANDCTLFHNSQLLRDLRKFQANNTGSRVVAPTDKTSTATATSSGSTTSVTAPSSAKQVKFVSVETPSCSQMRKGK